ncbi:unnamed protein product [Rhodiola kirilowii]
MHFCWYPYSLMESRRRRIG